MCKMCVHVEVYTCVWVYLEMLELPSVIIQLPPLVLNLSLLLPFLLLPRRHIFEVIQRLRAAKVF